MGAAAPAAVEVVDLLCHGKERADNVRNRFKNCDRAYIVCGVIVDSDGIQCGMECTAAPAAE